MAVAWTCRRGRGRWLAALAASSSIATAALVGGCSAQPPEAGPASGPSPRMADRNPFEDPDREPTREEIVARFLRARGVELKACAESEWVPIGEAGAVIATVRNRSDRPLTLRGERSRGIWPFTTVERSVAVLAVSVEAASLATGRQRWRETRHVEESATLEIGPGEERAIRLPIELAGGSLVCARARVQATLHPLAWIWGDEPERAIALRFPEVVVGFAPRPIAAVAASDAQGISTALDVALSGAATDVVAAAVRAGEADAAGTVDRLILAIPGGDAAARRARCVALEWLTRRSFGDQVEGWRGWWHSDAGAAFARDVAAAALEAGR